jgi:hypothetical protein
MVRLPHIEVVCVANLKAGREVFRVQLNDVEIPKASESPCIIGSRGSRDTRSVIVYQAISILSLLAAKRSLC